MTRARTDEPTSLERLVGEVATTFAVGMARIEAKVASSIDGIRLRGASARPVAPTQQTATISTVACQWLGYMFTNATTDDDAVQTVKLRFRDGREGSLLGSLTLAPGESTRDFFGPQGVACLYGLYVEIVTGRVEGSVFVGTDR